MSGTRVAHDGFTRGPINATLRPCCANPSAAASPGMPVPTTAMSNDDATMVKRLCRWALSVQLYFAPFATAKFASVNRHPVSHEQKAK